MSRKKGSQACLLASAQRRRLAGATTLVAGLAAVAPRAVAAQACPLCPQVTITPSSIASTAPVAIKIQAHFPEGLASITRVEASYQGIDVLALLAAYLSELEEYRATIELPALSFAFGTQATFLFELETLSGARASARLEIAVQACDIFPIDNPWNTDISSYPVHPNSDDYIASINESGGNGFLHADFGANPEYGIPYVVVPRDQPLVPIRFTEFGAESDPGPYPIPLDAPVEAGGDRHVLALQPGRCRLYELYHARQVGDGWEAGSGALFDLGSNALRPDGWTSADAAGLPILAGLVRYDQVEAGAIRHALRFTASRTQRGYIHPATHFASSDSDPRLPPMGLRLRLKADYDLSGIHGAARVALEAMKRYGLLLADNGTSWFISGASDPRWNDEDLEQLKRVPGNAFEAVLTGPIRFPDAAASLGHQRP